MKGLIFILMVLCLGSCMSVKKYNKHLNTTISEDKIKEDLTYCYKKLQKLHPNLYWYISKDTLDKKFDSLKSTINQPLTPNRLYEKLQPIITKIREGHLRLVEPSKKYTKKERKNLELQKGLFSRMGYLIDNNKIYVKDNEDQFADIKIGTEILKIKDIATQNYLDKYNTFINSDGYNTTYLKYSMARRWAAFFTIENGILDSVNIETKYKDEIKNFYIHRQKITKEEKKKEENSNKKLTKSDKGKTKDYNILTKSYNRDLQFPTKDSSVAYIKIKTFSGTYSKKFYKESFEKIKKNQSKILILDIRNNLGGSLSEINHLYSYLALDNFKFINDIKVTSFGSLYHADYFNQVPIILMPVAAIVYPLYFIGATFSNKTKNGEHYLRNNNAFSIKKPKENAFKGKIYVLINGSSFSAASILPSKLKNDKRAILVGEETGGANDGTVAGRYATKKLPHSKLILPIGLMLIQPNITFTNTKKGVTPDVEIIPTLENILQKKDIQLDWIMQDIKKEKTNVN